MIGFKQLYATFSGGEILGIEASFLTGLIIQNPLQVEDLYFPCYCKVCGEEASPQVLLSWVCSVIIPIHGCAREVVHH